MRPRVLGFLLGVVVLLGSVSAAPETPTALEARLLAGLSNPDEPARLAAVAEMERRRIADHEGETGPRSWPGDDEAEAKRPKTAYERMKLRIFDALLGKLRDVKPPVRLAVARSLGAMTPVTNDVVDGLAAALEDDRADVRLAVLESLAKIRTIWPGGPHVQTKLPAVAVRIDDADPRVRAQALRMLVWMFGPSGWDRRAKRDALARARKRLDDENAEVRAAALELVRRLDPRGEKLLARCVDFLEDPDADVRRIAAAGLGAAGARARGALGALRACLEDDDPVVRYTAVAAVWKIAREPAGLVPVLIELLGRPDEVDPSGPCAILTEIGPPAEAAGPAVAALLSRKERPTPFLVVGSPLRALYSLGPMEKAVRPALEKALADGADPGRVVLAVSALNGDHARLARWILELRATMEDPWQLAASAQALGIVGHVDGGVLAALRADLGSDDPGRVAAAVGAARCLGPAGRPLLAALFRGLRSVGDPRVRVELVSALAEVGGVEANRTLVGRLDDPELVTAAAAALVPPAPDLRPVLERRLGPARPAGKAALLDALRRLGAEPAPLVARLAVLLESEGAGVREVAARALGRFGAAAAPLRPRLERLARDGDRWHDGAAAALATWQAGGPPEPALRHLLDALRSSVPPPVHLVRALGEMGPLAGAAVPALMEIALDWRRSPHNGELRTRAAIEALGAVGPGASVALPLLRELARNRLFAREARDAILRIEPR